MSAARRPAQPPPREIRRAGGLFPIDVLRSVRAATGADVVTVYLSNPGAPHDRGSYVLLGESGASASYLPYLRGPLRPGSVARFSAHDRKKVRKVADVAADADFAASSFCCHHALRSLARLSVRLPTGLPAAAARQNGDAHASEPPPVPGVIPPFLELFLNYRRPRRDGELAAAAAAATQLLLDAAPRILGDPELRLLMDPREIAVRHRKLQRIADRFHDEHRAAIDSAAAADAVKRSIDACGKALARFVAGELASPRAAAPRLSFWFLDAWDGRPRDCEPLLLLAHPEERAEPVSHALRGPSDHGVLRFVGASGRSVAFERIEKAPAAWRALHRPSASAGAVLTVPLFSGTRPFALLQIESTQGGALLRRVRRLWQVVPAIEPLLRDVRERQAQLRDHEARVLLTSFTTTRFRPKHEAMGERLRQTVNRLGVTACSMTRVGGGRAAHHWTSALPTAGTTDLLATGAVQRLLVELAALLAEAGASASERPLALALRFGPVAGRTTELRASFAYRRSAGADEPGGRSSGPPQLRRTAFPHGTPAAACARALVAELARGLAPGVAGELVVVPNFTRARKGSGRREVGSLLALLTSDSETPASRPWLLTAVAVAHALGLALFTVESIEDQASLLAWATAGVGSIHDVVGALGRSVELIRTGAARRDELLLAADTLEGIRDQMALLDGLARGESLTPLADEETDFAAFMANVIRRAILISGNHPDDVVQRIAAVAAPVHVGRHLRSRVAGGLTNAIANALKYGGAGQPSVDANRGADGVVEVVIRNESFARTSVESLRAAREVVGQVREGDASEVLMRLLDASRGKPTLRGVGTWLTARIVREVLHGDFELDYATSSADPEVVEVRARVRFRFDGETLLAGPSGRG